MFRYFKQHSFNSTLVQLKVEGLDDMLYPSNSFNSTLVQLKVLSIRK